MTDTTTDLVDELAGIHSGDDLDLLRRRRPVTRAQLQASHDALFVPLDDSHFPLDERLLVAAFATRLTAADATAEHYADRAHQADATRSGLVQAEAVEHAVAGPYGRYTELDLQGESTDGPRYEPDARVRDALGERLAAALAHTHLLTYRPREASADAIDRLLEAGWSLDGVITLSQLVSFLAFQQRVASGLRVLAASAPADPSARSAASAQKENAA